MKRFMSVFLAIAAFAVCGTLFAADAAPAKKQNKRTIFSIGFFPGVPNSTNTYDTFGLKLGIPAVGGNDVWVCGQEASILYSATDVVKGCQATLAGPAVAEVMQGVQAAPGAAVTKDLIGFQASVFTLARGTAYGCQAGVANVAKKFSGFQTGAANIAYDKLNGMQFGAVNVVDEEFYGLQAGAVNVMTGLNKGVQLGAVNVSTQGGMQFGVICINSKSILPVMILFNYASSDYVPLADRKAAGK